MNRPPLEPKCPVWTPPLEEEFRLPVPGQNRQTNSQENPRRSRRD